MHEDIDRKDKDTALSAWQQFLDWYREIIYERVLLKKTDEVDINVCINIVVISKYSDAQKSMYSNVEEKRINMIKNCQKISGACSIRARCN